MGNNYWDVDGRRIQMVWSQINRRSARAEKHSRGKSTGSPSQRIKEVRLERFAALLIRDNGSIVSGLWLVVYSKKYQCISNLRMDDKA